MKIIAEIGTSHAGSLEKAFALIAAAKDAGADFIKFQWVYADEILHPDTGFVKLPGGSVRLYDRFKALEVDKSFFEKCIDYTHKKGLLFACSPFGLKSLRELVSCPVDAIKIASPEVNHFELLKEVSKYYSKIPIILSSGVSKLSDIEKAIEIIKSTYQKEKGLDEAPSINGIAPLTLLHCITSYPAPENEYNVKAVKTLSDIFGLPCGISDHSLDPVLVPVLADMMGGQMVEKHITLSKKTDGLDDPVALEADEFALMSHCIHQSDALLERWHKEKVAVKNNDNNFLENDFFLNQAQNQIVKQLLENYSLEKILAVLGTGKKSLAKSESLNYGRTNRSLHYMSSFLKGHKIQKDDIKILRTEKVLSPGISPEYLNLLEGATLVRNVENGQGVQFEDFIQKD